MHNKYKITRRSKWGILSKRGSEEAIVGRRSVIWRAVGSTLIFPGHGRVKPYLKRWLKHQSGQGCCTYVILCFALLCLAHIWRRNKSKRKVKRQANFIKRDFMFIPEIRFSVLQEWMADKEAAGYNGSNWPERGWWCLFWHGFFSLSTFYLFFVLFNLSFSVVSFWRIFTLSHDCLFIPLSELPVSEYREPAIASQVCFQDVFIHLLIFLCQIWCC